MLKTNFRFFFAINIHYMLKIYNVKKYSIIFNNFQGFKFFYVIKIVLNFEILF